ncbi:MAG: hypothetical protein JOZ42_04615 [Acetobacteraceae bacterium]|nr:hypothetical protein [Acetobacteraceae bacterium]
MSGKNKSDEFGLPGRGTTELYPGGDLWDDVGCQGETDLPGDESWLANLQVIEVVGVGVGVMALVISLLPLFFR